MVKNKNKHICVIVSCLLAVMIAITPLFTIRNNKITAKADSVASTNYLVLLPSFYFNYQQEQCIMPSMFFSVVSDTQVIFYRCTSNDGTKGSYTGYYYVLNKLVKTDGRIHYMRYVEGSKGFYTRFFDPGFNTFIEFAGDFSSISSSTTVSVEVAFNSSISGYGFRYNFLNPSSDILCYIDIVNFDASLTFFGANNIFNYTTIAAPVDINNLNQYLYDTGYQTGYNYGYNKGLNATWNDLSPWQSVVNGVNDFLSIKLFGDVSISVLLSIAFGCILLGFAIKIFLGG